MVASSWVLRVDAASKEKVEQWLGLEAKKDYVLLNEQDTVGVDFASIDDAFRFRMHFDEELVQ